MSKNKGNYYEMKQKLLEKLESLVKEGGKKGVNVEELVYNLQKILPVSDNFIEKEIEKRDNLGVFSYKNPLVFWNKEAKSD